MTLDADRAEDTTSISRTLSLGLCESYLAPWCIPYCPDGCHTRLRLQLCVQCHLVSFTAASKHTVWHLHVNKHLLILPYRCSGQITPVLPYPQQPRLLVRGHLNCRNGLLDIGKHSFIRFMSYKWWLGLETHQLTWVFKAWNTAAGAVYGSQVPNTCSLCSYCSCSMVKSKQLCKGELIGFCHVTMGSPLWAAILVYPFALQVSTQVMWLKTMNWLDTCMHHLSGLIAGNSEEFKIIAHCSCNSGGKAGCLVIGRLLFQLPAPPSCMSNCRWARYRTQNYSWWAFGTLQAVSTISAWMCVWMGDSNKCCKAALR